MTKRSIREQLFVKLLAYNSPCGLWLLSGILFIRVLEPLQLRGHLLGTFGAGDLL
jgi:hypothetical protein